MFNVSFPSCSTPCAVVLLPLLCCCCNVQLKIVGQGSILFLCSFLDLSQKSLALSQNARGHKKYLPLLLNGSWENAKHFLLWLWAFFAACFPVLIFVGRETQRAEEKEMWLFIEEGVRANPCSSCAYFSLSQSSIKPLTVQCYVLNLNNTWSKLLCYFNVYYIYEPSYGELYHPPTYLPSYKLLNYTGYTHTHAHIQIIECCKNLLKQCRCINCHISKTCWKEVSVWGQCHNIITKMNLSILYLCYQIIPLSCSLSNTWLSSSNSPKDFRRRLKFKINTTWNQQATISTSTLLYAAKLPQKFGQI